MAAGVLTGLCDGGLDPVRQVLADHRLQQLFLARVVQVQRALGDTRAVGHFFDAGGSETLLDEKLERCVQQLLRTGLLAALANREGGEIHASTGELTD